MVVQRHAASRRGSLWSHIERGPTKPLIMAPVTRKLGELLPVERGIPIVGVVPVRWIPFSCAIFFAVRIANHHGITVRQTDRQTQEKGSSSTRTMVSFPC